jgi:hypothetical protein
MSKVGSLYTNKSYLRNTGYRKFFLDVANLPKIDTTKGDYIVVPMECENRMDLFSYQQYGSSRLWWVIALANADMIKDPIWDFKSGMQVFVPRDSDLLEKIAGVN